MSEVEYGVCPKCWASYRIKKDRTLWSHTNLDSHITGLPFSSHCSGSGTAPERIYSVTTKQPTP